MFTIFGSGFGLYGYMPALLEQLGERVILPRRYLSVVEKRPELRQFLARIDWVEGHDEALSLCKNVVIALPPLAQELVVEKCLQHSGIKMLFLEKPIASDPDAADKLLAQLDAAHVKYSVGYSFIKTEWYGERLFEGHTNDEININWLFMAHHFKQNLRNWKRFHSAGGGPLRFYGIHLLALLALNGYDKVLESHFLPFTDEEPYCWTCLVTGPGRPPCRIRVDSRNEEPRFVIRSTERGDLVSLSDPFSYIDTQNGVDKRVEIVAQMVKAGLTQKKGANKRTIERSIDLWQQAERLAGGKSD